MTTIKFYAGTKGSKYSTADDYQVTDGVDNEAYDQSSTVVTSPSKVGTLLVIMYCNNNIIEIATLEI